MTPNSTFSCFSRSLTFLGFYSLQLLTDWYHRMPSIIDDLSLSKCLVLSYGWSYLAWKKRTIWSNYSAYVLSFTFAMGVHNSERLADLAVVRCREMEGGEIFATKAAVCFNPLHAICVLAKVGDWQAVLQIGILYLLHTRHSLCRERLPSTCLLQLVLSHLAQVGVDFLPMFHSRWLYAYQTPSHHMLTCFFHHFHLPMLY